MQKQFVVLALLLSPQVFPHWLKGAKVIKSSASAVRQGQSLKGDEFIELKSGETLEVRFRHDGHLVKAIGPLSLKVLERDCQPVGEFRPEQLQKVAPYVRTLDYTKMNDEGRLGGGLQRRHPLDASELALPRLALCCKEGHWSLAGERSQLTMVEIFSQPEGRLLKSYRVNSAEKETFFTGFSAQTGRAYRVQISGPARLQGTLSFRALEAQEEKVLATLNKAYIKAGSAGLSRDQLCQYADLGHFTPIAEKLVEEGSAMPSDSAAIGALIDLYSGPLQDETRLKFWNHHED